MEKAKTSTETVVEGQRLALVAIPTSGRHDFIEAWQAGETDVPVDAEFQGDLYSFDRNCLLLKFSHSSFKPVPFGQVIPLFVKGV
jgi:hypothetical protein